MSTISGFDFDILDGLPPGEARSESQPGGLRVTWSATMDSINVRPGLAPAPSADWVQVLHEFGTEARESPRRLNVFFGDFSSDQASTP